MTIAHYCDSVHIDAKQRIHAKMKQQQKQNIHIKMKNNLSCDKQNSLLCLTKIVAISLNHSIMHYKS